MTHVLQRITHDFFKRRNLHNTTYISEQTYIMTYTYFTSLEFFVTPNLNNVNKS